MSRAGPGEQGFTLVELLVVLVILALGVGVALPRLSGLLGPDIDRTTREVALALRDQRTKAMRTGRIVLLTADDLRPLLPAGTVIDEDGMGEPGLAFLPTGATSGGRVVLAASDGRRAVEVDWLTGRVTVEPVP